MPKHIFYFIFLPNEHFSWPRKPDLEAPSGMHGSNSQSHYTLVLTKKLTTPVEVMLLGAIESRFDIINVKYVHNGSIILICVTMKRGEPTATLNRIFSVS